MELSSEYAYYNLIINPIHKFQKPT